MAAPYGIIAANFWTLTEIVKVSDPQVNPKGSRVWEQGEIELGAVDRRKIPSRYYNWQEKWR
jgi:hypothetical protein